MARQNGKDCRVYLGGRDASGDVAEITAACSAATHDTTTLGDDWIEHTAGLLAWEASFVALHDPAAGAIGPQTEDVGGSFVLSIYDGDADAVGDSGIVTPAGILESRATPIAVSDMVKLNCSLKGTGRAGLSAKLVHVLGQETITGTGTALDNSASSANGGRGNLHVTAITGTWTIVIQHSDNNGGGDPYTTVLSFAQVAAAGGATAESVQVSGTVKQWLRISFTEDVAGSITFVCGFARY